MEKRPRKGLDGTPMLMDLIEEYRRMYATGKGHTARAKNGDINSWLNYLSAKRGKRPELLLVREWTHEITAEYIEFLLLREAPATVARRLATIKHMGRCLSEAYPSFINPARAIKGPRQEPCAPRGINDAEIAQMRENAHKRAENGNFMHIRNRAIFELLLATGLRADEVRTMRRGQLTPTLDWCRKVKCKGAKYRNVYVKEDVRDMLRDYLCHRAVALRTAIPRLDRILDSELPLFPSLYSADPKIISSFFMSPKTLWRAISSLAPGAHPHALRHTFAHWLHDKTGKIRLVTQALGHSSVNVTMRYTERSDEDLAEAIEGGEIA